MPTTGQRISEYILQDRIGAGTFGEVWRAHHHVWAQQQVAIKIPNNAEFIRDLQREGLVAAGLEHPNVVKAIGFDPYADPPYLVMQYIPGESLRGVIRQGPMKVPDVIAVMKQILHGLTYAHGRGIVHRDLKPENVLIEQTARQKGFGEPGVVKITDFGFGQRPQTGAGSIAYSMSLDPEQAKRIVGTLDYMSPEQRSGEPVDARSDLYACGVILFELITGEKPTGTEMLSDLRTGVPESLDEAFRRAYTRLDRRFASAQEMSEALVIGPPALGSVVPARINPAPDRYPEGMVACRRCQRPVGAKDQFCMHCGVQMVNEVRRCAHCGAYPSPDDQYCTQCGRTLTRMRVAT